MHPSVIAVMFKPQLVNNVKALLQLFKGKKHSIKNTNVLRENEVCLQMTFVEIMDSGKVGCIVDLLNTSAKIAPSITMTRKVSPSIWAFVVYKSQRQKQNSSVQYRPRLMYRSRIYDNMGYSTYVVGFP